MGVASRMLAPLWALALALACAQHVGHPLRGMSFLPPLRTAPVVRARNPAHNGRVCSTWGNFHYKTFDGDVFRFPGRCNYVLSAHCGAAYEDFNVQLRRGGESNATTVTAVTMKLDGMVIQLTKSSILVNGRPTQPPFSQSGVLIEVSNGYLKVDAKLGLVLMWSPDDSLLLELDPKFANQTCGLCGDFNGQPVFNEFLSHGVKLTALEYGNLQKMDGPTEQCQDPVPVPPTDCGRGTGPCEETLTGQLFSGCRALLDAGSYVQACRQDLCLCEHADRARCICSTLAEYARQCAHAGGLPPDWRSPHLCPQTCPPRMQHRECGSPCADTCSNPEHSQLCEDHCVDGCFCPEGTVFDDIGQTGCIPASQCPCVYNGATYAPGTSYATDCTNCTCSRGQWSCRELPCPGTCAVLGGAHISTFDERQYTVHGDCSYVLAKPCDSSVFTVLGELRRCGLTDTETCLKSLTLSLDGGHTVVTVKASGEVFVNQIYTQMPVSAANVTLFRPSTFFIVAQTKLGLQLGIQLVPVMQVFVRLGPELRGLTCGLCGNFNQNQADDFRTLSGVVEGTAAAFANTWKTQASCPNVKNSFEDPCSLSVENEKYAQRWCSRLTDPRGPFAQCHAAVNPGTFYSNCMFDTCNCEKSEDCLCAALSSYVHACAARGVLLRGWRDGVCAKPMATCPKSLTYQYSISTCQPTCRARSHEDITCGISFVPVDGCTCPNGTFLDEAGKCVPATSCPCYHEGSVVPNGESLHERGVICTCTQGTLTCIGGQVPTPVCTPPMVFLDCRNTTPGASGAGCQKSCFTLDMDCYSPQCEPGCVCPDGLVADGEGRCVAPTDCPCVHNEASYLPGQTIRVGCNTCTCENRKWRCTEEPCLATCAVYRDGHYVTFDGRRYSFSGDCGYTLLQDHCRGNDTTGTFRVVSENVPCGTTGVTCSKAIKLFLGSFELRLNEGRVEVLERGVGQEPPYSIRQMGIYLVVDTEAGLVLLWDRKTSIFLKLSPEFKGRVCGLCGNFDDNAVNDFTTRSQSVVGSALEFGNSWKFSPACPDAPAPRDPCTANPYRKSWAQKQCSIINSATFAACHAHVEPTKYYEACVGDACACDSGGDCECFCTAVAAYAQACHDVGVCVSWRTPDTCPLFCDYYNPEGQCEWHYQPCGAPCMRTCRNPGGRCLHDLPGLEGCYPKCPPAAPIFDEDRMQCVATCPTPPPPLPCRVRGKSYRPGTVVPSDQNCHSCICTENGVQCAYDSEACVCIYDGRHFRPGDVIYHTTDGTGGCLSARCSANGTIERGVSPCSATSPAPPTTFSFSTSAPVVSSTRPPRTCHDCGKSTVPTGTTPGTTVQPHQACGEECQWSPWLDISRPGRGTDSGDFDTLENLRAHGYQVCTAPKKVECQAEGAPGVPLPVLGQHVECSPTVGLTCYNHKQTSGLCHNYQIRILCCFPRTCSPSSSPAQTTLPAASGNTETGPTREVSGVSSVPTEHKTSPATVAATGTSVLSTTSETPAPGATAPVQATATTTPGTPTPAPGTTTTPPGTPTPAPGTTTTPPGTPTPAPRTTTTPPGTPTPAPGTTTTPPGTPTPAPGTTTTPPGTPTPALEKTTLLTLTPMPISTTHEPCLKQLCTWTHWIDSSYPEPGINSGDFDTFPNLRAKGYKFCAKPNNVECRAEFFPNVPLEELGQDLICDKNVGLLCLNKNQLPPICYNYAIRIECCEQVDVCTSTPHAGSSEVTHPTPRDTETQTQRTRNTGIPSLPTQRGIASSAPVHLAASTTPNTYGVSSPVTVTCQPQCTWTKWFDVDFPSPGPHGGDVESFSNIMRRGEKICRRPEYISRLECRAESHPEVSIEKLGQVVQCDLSKGLVCRNRDQGGNVGMCLNYEVRVLCCEPPEHCTTHKTVTVPHTPSMSPTSLTETTVHLVTSHSTSVPTTSPTTVPETSSTSVPTTSPRPVPETSSTSVPTTSPRPVSETSSTSVPTTSPTTVPETSSTSVPTTSPRPVPETSSTSEPTTSPKPVSETSSTSVPTTSPTSVPETSSTSVPTSSPTSVPETSSTPVPATSPTSVPETSSTSVPTTSPRPVSETSSTSVPTTSPTSVPETSSTPVPATSPTSVPETSSTTVPASSPTSVPTTSSTTVSWTSPTSVPPTGTTSAPTASTTPVHTPEATHSPPVTVTCQPQCTWTKWFDVDFPSPGPHGGDVESFSNIMRRGEKICRRPEYISRLECRAESHPEVSIEKLGQVVQCDLSKGLVCRNRDQGGNVGMCLNYEVRVLCCEPPEHCTTHKTVTVPHTPSMSPTSLTETTVHLVTSHSTSVPTSSPTSVPETSSTSVPTTSPRPVPETSSTPVPTTSPRPVPETSSTSVPTTSPTSVPETSSTSVPTSSPTSVPETSSTPVPATSPTLVPETSSTSVPTTSPRPVSETSSTSVPTTSPTTVPETSSTSVPTTSPRPVPETSSTSEPTTSPKPVSETSSTSVPTTSPTSVPETSSTSVPTSSPTSVPETSSTPVPATSPTSVPETSSTSVPTTSPRPVSETSSTSVPTTSPTSVPETSSTPVPATSPTSVPETSSTTVPASSPTSVPTTSSTTVSWTSPTSVPPTGTTSAPTASTTPVHTPEATHSPPVTVTCQPQCTWTKWFDVDFPSPGPHGGDVESFSNIMRRGEKICRRPEYISRLECRAESHPEVSIEKLGQVVQCDLSKGLVCRNRDQGGNVGMCLNYEVRVLCCEPPEHCTTHKTVTVPHTPSMSPTSLTETTVHLVTSHSTSVPTSSPTSVPETSSTSVPTTSPRPVPETSSTPVPTTSPRPVPETSSTSVPTTSPTSVPETSSTSVPTSSPTSVPETSSTPVPATSPTLVPETSSTSVPTTSPRPVSETSSTSVPTTSPTTVPETSSTSVPTTSPRPVPETSSTSEPTTSPKPVSETSSTSVPTTSPTSVPETSSTSVPTSSPTSVPETSSTPVPATSPTSVPETSSTSVPTTSPRPVSETSSTSVPTTSPTSVPETSSTPVPATSPTSVPETSSTTVPASSPTSVPTTSSTTVSWTSPTSVPPTGTTSAPTASTTPVHTPEATHSPPVTVTCQPQCTWTKWFDVDFPSPGPHGGDVESFSNIMRRGEKICRRPEYISRLECRAESHPEVSIEKLGQVVQCDLSKGLVCRNRDQGGNVGMCLNYEVRVLCCEPPEHCTTHKTVTVPHTPSMNPTSLTETTVHLVTSHSTSVPTSSPTSVPETSSTSVPTTSPRPVPETSSTPVPTTSPRPVPETSSTSVPTTSPTSVPETSSTPVPATSPTSVPETSSTSVPTTSPTTVPETSSTPVPTTSPTSVPETSSTTVPASSPTSVPTTSATTVSRTSPTSVPPTGTTSAPTASTTPVHTPEATHSPPVTVTCQPQCTWTKWFDVDFPSPGPHGGDTESFSNIMRRGEKICRRPEYISRLECRAESHPEVSIEKLGQVVQCDHSKGLVCRNRDQGGNVGMCLNYEVRVLCCEPPEHCTTHKTVTVPHTPSMSPTSLTETTLHLVTSHSTSVPISSPTSVPETSSTSVPTTSPRPVSETSSTSVPTTSPRPVSDTHSTSVPTTSPTTVPETSSTPVPTTSPRPVSETSSTSVPTTSPTSVPETSPTSVPETSSTTVPASSPTSVPTTSSTTVSWTSPTSVPPTGTTSAPTASTTPVHTPEATHSPPVTVTCQPQCTWTKWFDVDFPSPGPHGGDVESFSNIMRRGEKICRRPEYISRLECRAESHPEVSIEKLGQVVQCDLSKGLVCRNRDQGGNVGMCLNYEVRVLCCERPEHCGHTSVTPSSAPPEHTSVVSSVPWPSSTAPASTTCFCSVSGKLYPAGSIIYQQTDLDGHCYYATCSLDCHVVRQMDQSCPSSVAPPAPTTSQPGSSPSAPVPITTQGCPNAVPPRMKGETWPMPNCSQATCEGHGVITVHRRECPRAQPPTCANGFPPVQVADQDGCCPRYQCQCVCSGWGDPHYITFDGTYYTFLDNCTYVLVQQVVPVYGHFRVLIDNYLCGAENGVSCPQSIIVEYRGDRVVLTRKPVLGVMTNEIIFNDRVVRPGFQKDGVSVSQIGIKMYVTIPELGVQVMFSGLIFSVEVPFSKFANNTEGQCGTCTNDKKDECRLPGGAVAASCSDMSGHWKVTTPQQPSCRGPSPTPAAARPAPSPAPCFSSPICRLILSKVFEPCHAVIPPLTFYQGCVFDHCHVTVSDVVCSGLELYASLCASRGVCIDWRSHTNHTCPFACPADKVYQPCGPSKLSYCYGRDNASLMALQDAGPITEGCFCPEGLMPFSTSSEVCVPTDCHRCLGPHGEPVEPGHTVSVGCRQCTCENGTWTLSCRPQPCPLPPACPAPGLVPVPAAPQTDQCCPQYNCACDTSYCPKPVACPEGSHPILTYEEGACCPHQNCSWNVCSVNGTLFQPGSVVSSSLCETCRCEAPGSPHSDTAVISCETQICNTRCPEGFEYREQSGRCCGGCVQQACVLNATDGSPHLFYPGQSWPDPTNPCVTHECEKHPDGLVVVTRKKACPPLSCPADQARLSKDGCCLSCPPPQPQNRSACALFHERQVLHQQGCRSPRPVRLAFCRGSCGDSVSVYSQEANTLRHSCECCQERRVSLRNVTLRCPDGSHRAFSYPQVEECGCVRQRCGSHGALGHGADSGPVQSDEEQSQEVGGTGWRRGSRATGPTSGLTSPRSRGSRPPPSGIHR
ncbi:mucin-5AC isoform X2 [Mustela erminea]|uniref:mucin-5AC isoform X2 n=1 Tax=Mustela erminea TaxID=36723 RepID=UPI00138734AC|nr:mucin-5AC isoform X2 [Mustela erminea]